MDNKHWTNIGSINVRYTQRQKRYCTDVCCLIIGLAFTAILIAAAAMHFNKTTFYKVNFPTDSDGQLCGRDLPNYQYILFTNLPLTTQRVCVSKCPSKGDQFMSCHPNSDITNCSFISSHRYYNSVVQRTRLGQYCSPINQSVKNILKQKTHICDQFSYYQALFIIKRAILVSVIASFVYLLLVQHIPKLMPFIIIVLGVIVLVAAILVLMFSSYQIWMRNTMVTGLVIVVIIILISIFKNTKIKFKIHAIFMQYSARMLGNRISIFIYIPLYIFGLLCLVALVVFQYIGFWSARNAIFAKEDVFFTLKDQPILEAVCILPIIHLVWGACFLKQSFNFCISGNSILWFYLQNHQQLIKHSIFQPLTIQITKHFGSVIGGSFMTAFFYFFGVVLDFISCQPCTNYCTNMKEDCLALLNLVRSDVMAYIALTGHYCEYICNNTILNDDNQSYRRIYRLCAHICIAGLSLSCTMLTAENKSISAVGLVIFVSFVISTFFISLHADGAEAIQLLLVADLQLLNRQNKDNELLKTSFKEKIAQQIYKLIQTQYQNK